MRTNVLLKALIVFGVAVSFFVPLAMILDVVQSRSRYRDEARAEIARNTANPQYVVGPVILVSYKAAGPGDGSVREGHAVLLPDSLAIHSQAHVETRARGIYRVPVFRAATRLEAAFDLPADLVPKDLRLVEEPRVQVVFGVSDPRGIRGGPDVKIDGVTMKPHAGVGSNWLKTGFGVDLPPGSAGRTVAVQGDLEIMGTEQLLFLPVGEVTTVDVTSQWPHPSFVGGFLPDTRTVSAKGFQAHWKLSDFATGVNDAVARVERLGAPADQSPGFPDHDLGVRFIQPVDVYQQSERAVKYGFLFVLLTLVAFYLFEVLRRLAVHPIQYALCGGALAIFFLLLASLSEHLPFAAAYSIASVACVGLISFYVGHVLRSARRGLAFGGVLGALYGFLYVILMSEDYALLLCAVLLFAALALVMIMTRRVDWYRISEEAPAVR
jgi:inner membrane protein